MTTPSEEPMERCGGTTRLPCRMSPPGNCGGDCFKCPGCPDCEQRNSPVQGVETDQSGANRQVPPVQNGSSEPLETVVQCPDCDGSGYWASEIGNSRATGQCFTCNPPPEQERCPTCGERPDRPGKVRDHSFSATDPEFGWDRCTDDVHRRERTTPSGTNVEDDVSSFSARKLDNSEDGERFQRIQTHEDGCYAWVSGRVCECPYEDWVPATSLTEARRELDELQRGGEVMVLHLANVTAERDKALELACCELTDSQKHQADCPRILYQDTCEALDKVRSERERYRTSAAMLSQKVIKAREERDEAEHVLATVRTEGNARADYWEQSAQEWRARAEGLEQAVARFKERTEDASR